MVYPVIWAVIIVAKLVATFKTGQKHKTTQMKEALNEVMEENNFPTEYSQEIMKRMDEKVDADEMPLDDFLKAFMSVIDDLKVNIKGKLETAVDSMADATVGVRKWAANLFEEAADSLRSDDDEKSEKTK